MNNPAKGTAMSSPRERTPSNASKQTILLVDDDPSVREMIGRVLLAEGYLVLSAANGAEALSLAASSRIDLVLLDLNMPGQGGWDTFEELASADPLRPVIIVTARPNQLFTSLGAGVGALLEKPLDYPGMLETVRTVLAESPQVRLARRAGHYADFHYLAPDGRTSGWRTASPPDSVATSAGEMGATRRGVE
jgi:DNA-binding response OmpR family regulator